MKTPPRLGPVFSLVVLLVLGGWVAPAQEGKFTERVDVNVVNVDVYVTDRKGIPVTNLSAADFEIREDGKKVPVEYFAAFVGDGLAISGEASAAAASPAAAGGGATAQGQEDPNHIVLFVDNANSAPQNRNRALAEIGPFLERWAQNEGKVMIVTFGSRAEVQQHFTDDPGLIRANLEHLANESGGTMEGNAARRAALASVQTVLRFLAEPSGGLGGGSGADFARMELDSLLRQVETFSESAYREVVRNVEVMKGVVSSLAVLQGRKIVVHLSDGMPLRPGEDLIFAVQDAFRDGRGVGPLSDAGGSANEDEGGDGASGGVQAGVDTRDPLTFEISRMRSEISRYDTSRFFTELVALANANRVTFYTVNGAGGDPSVLGADFASDAGFGASTQGLLGVSQSALRESLQMMAAETGGLSLLGGTNVDGLMAEVGQDLNSYYSLGYSAPKKGKDGIRSIKVKVKGRGLDVRYRQSYLPREGGPGITDKVTGALFLDVDENPHGLAVEVANQQSDPEGEGTFIVTLLVKIPIGELTLVPNGAAHEATLEVHVATMDPDGRSSPVRSVPLGIQVPAEQVEAARSQFYGAQLPLRMRSGEARVAVAVRDTVSDLVSYVSTPMEVGGE